MQEGPLPPEPYTLLVPSTTLHLTFTDYAHPPLPISQVTYLQLALLAQNAIVHAQAIAPFDPVIRSPTLKWKYQQNTFLSVNNANLEMSWEMLSDALQGVETFFAQFQTVAVTVKLVSNGHYVGDVEVGLSARDLGGQDGNITAIY